MPTKFLDGSSFWRDGNPSGPYDAYDGLLSDDYPRRLKFTVSDGTPAETYHISMEEKSEDYFEGTWSNNPRGRNSVSGSIDFGGSSISMNGSWQQGSASYDWEVELS